MTNQKPLKLNATGDPAEFTTGDTITPAFLPNPTTSTLGGIESFAAVAHQFINQISTSGVPSAAQPSAGDISGLGTAATENLSAVIIDNGSGALTIGTAQVTSAMIVNSVNLNGNPTTTTPAAGDNSTKIATTAYTLRDIYTTPMAYAMFGGV